VEADGTVGGRFGADEQFGAVVSVNYSKRNIESENYQGSSNWANGLPDGNGIRDYNLTRTRLGVVGNFDWHPSATAKIYLRTSYSEYKDNETRDQNRLAYLSPGTASTAATATVLVRRRIENDNTKSATLGGEFSDVAGGTLSLSGGWTRGKEGPAAQRIHLFHGEGRRDRALQRQHLSLYAGAHDRHFQHAFGLHFQQGEFRDPPCGGADLAGPDRLHPPAGRRFHLCRGRQAALARQDRRP
jgi:hypothetical protein